VPYYGVEDMTNKGYLATIKYE